jgi:16S rRNA (cytosine1402-N4)-methyltransferase
VFTAVATPERPRVDRAKHRPVMVREVLRWLDLRSGLAVADGTVGAGGHSAAILPIIQPGGRLIGLDRDPMMLAHAARAVSGEGVNLIHSSYADLRDVLDRLGVAKVDRVLLDLGLSSDQLSDEGRGFSFKAEGPLDLRFDASRGKPAAQLLASAGVAELARLFRELGEEPHADRIAEQIAASRSFRPVRTAKDLADIVEAAVPHSGRRSETHPATRVFQALRIAVNDELDELRRMLDETLPACLAPHGRAVIISFHSLEDRIVKEAFRNRDRWRDLTPKPIPPTPSEQRINPRSRTAKIRAAELN